MLGCEFKRIQFTPDLMPADITGTNVFNLQRNEFSLVKGPLFTTFLLADEINRAPAKTQSALLEAMQERTVTIDRESHRLSPNFTVFATQNPIESEGTYPLPEAQKDRFMLKIAMTWPESAEELSLARRSLGADAPEAVLQRGEVTPCLTGGRTGATAGGARRRSSVSDQLVEYVVEVVRRTRTDDNILVGAGPRATQSLLRAARAWAALAGRDFVSPDDIRAVAAPGAWSIACCCVPNRSWKACAPAKCWTAFCMRCRCRDEDACPGVCSFRLVTVGQTIVFRGLPGRFFRCAQRLAELDR